MEHQPSLPSHPAGLPPRLADVLHRLHDAEQTATGPDRRVAFRNTRAVLGAMRANGVPLRDLAECLGATVGSMRGRAIRTDLALPEALIHQLTGQTPADLSELSGVLLQPSPGTGDYPVDDFVRTLLAIPAGR